MHARLSSVRSGAPCVAAAGCLSILVVSRAAFAQQPPSQPTEATTTAATETDEPEKIEQVEVIGDRPHPSRIGREPGVAGSVVARERLSQPGVSLSDALREAPGVQVTQAGGLGAPATARLRGATAAQTPVYLDKVRINDEVGGVADLSTVPSYFVERIEVYRGHAPRHMTELGLGGALVLVPRRPQEATSAVQVEAGSYGMRALRGRFGISQGERRLLVAAEANGADNNYPYTDSRGTLFIKDDERTARLPNADSSGTSVWLNASDRLGSAHVSLIAHHAYREQGAPKLALVPTETARAAFARSLFALTSTIPFDSSTLTLSSRAILGTTTLDDPQQELGMLTPRAKTPGERIEQLVEFSHRPSDSWWLSAQLSSSVERLRRFEREGGKDNLAIAAKRVILRPALGVDYKPTPKVTLAALAAANCVGTAQDALTICQNTTVTGRASARYSERNWEIYTNAGRYQRLATLSEMYGMSVLVRGNSSLKPEVGWSPEVGARWQLPSRHGAAWLWLDASGFARFSSDLITYVRSAQGYLRPVNRKTARTVGGEFALGSSPARGLNLEANVSLLDARDTSDDRVTENDILPFVSRAVANARISYEYYFDSLPAWDSISSSFHVYHQSSRYADPAGLGVIPAQTFGDVELGTSAWKGLITAKLRVSNVWNTQRYDIVGFPLPPRSVFFNTEITW